MRPLLLLLLGCGPTGSGSVAPDETSDSRPADALPEGVAIEDGAVVQPHKIVTITLDVAAQAWLECQLDSDFQEIHIAESLQVTDTHRFELLGLAAGEDYTCTLHIVGSQEELAFALPVDTVDGAPPFSVERHPTEPMSGVYTITNTTGGCFQGNRSLVIIADPEGRHRWVYDLGQGLVADIDAGLTPDGNIHMGGGWGLIDIEQSNRGVFRTVAPDGTTLIDREEPDFGLGFNHHSEAMEDGTYLSLTTSLNTDGDNDWYGIGVERWDPQSDTVVYQFDTQDLVDQGLLSWRPGNDNPYHANSASWLTDLEGDALYLSLYGAKEIWRIDRQTGLRSWRLGANADFDLLDVEGNPLPDEEWFYVQHDPDWTADGRVLLYDNGYQRPGDDYSRVSEYQLDVEDRTATLLWTWTEPNFYNPVVGDADWLDNGNVLVAKGFMFCWTPTSPDVSAVVEVNPTTDEVVWRMSWPDRYETLFRAERYDGCEVFPQNTKHCPAATERLSELRAL